MKGLVGWVVGLVSLGVVFYVISYGWTKGSEA